MNGHTVESFYKVHGYPPWFKSFIERKAVAANIEHDKVTLHQLNQLLQILQTQQQQDWLLDSGATDYICCKLHCFSDYETLEAVIITLLHVIEEGSVLPIKELLN
ncbi:Peptide chain release factor 1-like mitochondrial [Bienertia sinuspersici]